MLTLLSIWGINVNIEAPAGLGKGIGKGRWDRFGSVYALWTNIYYFIIVSSSISPLFINKGELNFSKMLIKRKEINVNTKMKGIKVDRA